MTTPQHREAARRAGIDLDFEDAMLRELGEGEYQHVGGSQPAGHANYTSAMARPNPSTLVSSVPLAVDLELEDRMMHEFGTDVAENQGYFMPRSWVFSQKSEVTLDASDLPTIVHTFSRDTSYQAIVHDKHPYVALVYLLAQAEENSQVYVSIPYFTDLHLIDELCYYAKPVVDGGKNLSVRIILGPEEWVRDRLNKYISLAPTAGGRALRKDAVDRLAVKTFGNQKRYCHSKAFVTTAGALVGSYSYTYAARKMHFEEGVVLAPGPQVEALKKRLEQLWEYGVTFEPRDITNAMPGIAEGTAPKKAKLDNSA
jgi:hypothetical protein